MRSRHRTPPFTNPSSPFPVEEAPTSSMERHPPFSMYWVQFNSVAQSCLTLRPHGLQHARPPCPSPTPGVYTNSCPLSQSYHPIISSSVVPFSSCLQSFPASRSFQMSQFFTSGGENIDISALTSVLPMNILD